MKWIAFVDESGDHGIENIDPGSPMFALVACIYRTDSYLTGELISVGRLKHRFWGHEGAILRAYDIAKKQGFFSFCVDAKKKRELWNAITEIFDNSTMKIIAAVIDKPRFKKQYADPMNCYKLACQFVLEQTFLMTGGDVSFVFESRGKTEDRQVESWCNEISSGTNAIGKAFDFKIGFAKKSWNVAGLQMADLSCQPVIHFVQNQDTKRPDWVAVRAKLRENRNTGNFMGYGLKVFPSLPLKS